MEPPKTAPIIEVAQLVKRFKNFTAVDTISFTVGAGEIFAFMGPNGAGRSTTIMFTITKTFPRIGLVKRTEEILAGL